MKQVISFFTFILVLTGCGPETKIKNEEQKAKGPLEVIIENEAYNFYQKNVGVYITENDEIRVLITYAETDVPLMSYAVGFIFKNNNLSEVIMAYIKNGKTYHTADFNLTDNFHIKNYKYDPTTRDLYFEYEGKLFERLSEVNLNASSITIKGKIDQKNIEKRTESVFHPQIATFSYQNSTFYPVIYLPSRGKDGEWVFHHDFITNSGDRIRFSFDQFTVNSPLLPKQYTFDEKSAKDNITFYKFDGKPRATVYYIIRDEDWIKYSCSGTFTIAEHFAIADYHITKGTFTLQVYDNNNNPLFKTEDGKFVIKQ